MYLKHTALTTALLLMLTGTALGEGPTVPETTVASAISTFQAETATYPARDATYHAVIATKQPLNATGEAFSAHRTATTGMQVPRRSERSSTGEDYTTQSVSAQEQMMLNLINSDRAANGLPPLVHDPALSRIARMKSQDMRDQNYFAHESPTWGYARDMLRTLGYEFRGAGENIAHHATVQKAQAAFLSSPGHRRNILSAVWEKVGVGIVTDRNGYVLVTQIFAK